jgi:hypothetical protein
MFVTSKEEIIDNLFVLYGKAIIDAFNLPEDQIFVAADAIEIVGVEPIFQFIFDRTKKEYEEAQNYIYKANKIEGLDRLSVAKKKLQLRQGQLLTELYWPRLMACYRIMHNDNGINYNLVEEANKDIRLSGAKLGNIE